MCACPLTRRTPVKPPSTPPLLILVLAASSLIAITAASPLSTKWSPEVVLTEQSRLCETSSLVTGGSVGRCTSSLACPLLGGRNSGICHLGVGYTCCLFDRCLTPPPSSRGAISEPVSSHVVGSSLTYQCIGDDNVFADGQTSVTVVCNAQRRWHPDHVPDCVSAVDTQVKVCQDLPVWDGSVEPVLNSSGYENIPVGESVTAVCPQDHVFVSGQSIVQVWCEAADLWSMSSIPACVPDPCSLSAVCGELGQCRVQCAGQLCHAHCDCHPPLVIAADGSCELDTLAGCDQLPVMSHSADMVPLSNFSGTVDVGVSIHVHCPPPYTLSASSHTDQIRCLGNNTWTVDELPPCLLDFCLIIDCGLGECLSNCSQTECDAHCVCQDNAVWEESSDSCVSDTESTTTAEPDMSDFCLISQLPSHLVSSFSNMSRVDTGQTLNISCSTGQLMTAESQQLPVTCTGSGEWTPDVFNIICVEDPCIIGDDSCMNSQCISVCSENSQNCVATCTCQDDHVFVESQGCMPDVCVGGSVCGDSDKYNWRVNCSDASDICVCQCECRDIYSDIDGRCVNCNQQPMPQECHPRQQEPVQYQCNEDLDNVQFKLTADCVNNYCYLLGDILTTHEPVYNSRLQVLESNASSCSSDQIIDVFNTPQNDDDYLLVDVQNYRYLVDMMLHVPENSPEDHDDDADDGDNDDGDDYRGRRVMLFEGIMQNVAGCCQLKGPDTSDTENSSKICTTDIDCSSVGDNMKCVDGTCQCDSFSHKDGSTCRLYVDNYSILLHYFTPDDFQPGTPDVDIRWPMECAENQAMVGVADRSSSHDLDYIKCATLLNVNLLPVGGSTFDPSVAPDQARCGPNQLAVAVWDDRAHFTSVDHVKCRRLAAGHVTNTCETFSLSAVMIADSSLVQNPRFTLPAQCSRRGLWAVTALSRHRARWTSMTCCRVVIDGQPW